MTIEEHEPYARWNADALVNPQGEIFVADFDGELPQLEAADARAPEVTARLAETARQDSATADLDEEFRNRLLSLGYIAGTEAKVRRGEARDPKEVALLI